MMRRKSGQQDSPPDKLVMAGEKMSQSPESLQLRYLGTLNDIAGEKSSTIVFPLPLDMKNFLKVVQQGG